MTETVDRSEPRRHQPEPTRQLSWETDPDRGPITLAFATALGRALAAEAGDRPGWSPRQIMTAFDELRDQQPADLRRAAYIVLDRPGSVAADVALAGEHWDVVVVPQSPPKLALVREAGRPASKGRDESWWAERDRVAAEDRARREALVRERVEAALALDRKRLAAHGVPEPRHD